MVYVLSKNGQSIMPTKNHAKVRLLLKSGKSKVVKRTPFTIQLIGASKTFTQEVSLGVDAGSRHVGLSATTTKQELLASINDGYAKLCEQIAKVSGEEKAKAVHTARFPYNDFLFQTYDDLEEDNN